MNPSPLFDHERLHAYQDSILFVAAADELLERIPKHLAVWDQLDRASTSIPLNLAEGNGKFTIPDRCRYFESARGSALECAACLDVLVAKKRLKAADIIEPKRLLHGIVSMPIGLIRSQAPDRLREDEVEYRAGGESAESKSRSKITSKSKVRS
jgi:four helix bundle protein